MKKYNDIEVKEDCFAYKEPIDKRKIAREFITFVTSASIEQEMIKSKSE